MSLLTAFATYFTRTAAVAPCFLKIPLLYRAADFFQKFGPQPLPLQTNLGIQSSLRVTLSNTVSSLLLFGRPAQYVSERGALEVCKTLVGPCDAFIDIGANIGYFTFYMRAHCTKPIYFFEPNKILFESLRDNLAANGMRDVVGVPKAVGAADGVTSFFIDAEDDAYSSICTPGTGRQVTEVQVQCTSFASFVREHSLKNLLVKVDIENAEFEFLEGVGEARPAIQYMVIEVLLPAMKKGFLDHAQQKLGMHAYYINGYDLYPWDRQNFVYQHPHLNWLFAKENPEELARKFSGSKIRVKKK